MRITVKTIPLPRWSVWIGVTSVSWALSWITLSGRSVRSWLELGEVFWTYIASGLVIGVVSGFAQGHFLRQQTKALRHWAVVTAGAYPLGFGLGIGFWTWMSFRWWPKEIPFLSSGSSWFIILAPLNISLVAGLVVSLAQWLLLRRLTPQPKWRACLAWSLATISGLGLGALLGPLVTYLCSGYFDLPMWVGQLAGRSVLGAVLGAVTGVFLFPWLQPSITAA